VRHRAQPLGCTTRSIEAVLAMLKVCHLDAAATSVSGDAFRGAGTGVRHPFGRESARPPCGPAWVCTERSIAAPLQLATSRHGSFGHYSGTAESAQTT
jgi:hypothetical protein